MAAIEQDGRSLRKLSQDANLGPNYVFQLIDRWEKTNKHPFIKFLLLLDELNVSRPYIFSGVHMTIEEEEILRLFSALSEKQKNNFLEILRSIRLDSAATT